MKRVAVIWTGKRPPTAAQKRALAKAAKSGKLRSGDRVGPARVRKNPSGAEHAYREFHWGNGHDRVERVRLPSYKQGLYKLGDLVAVEYRTRKGRGRDSDAIWVHHFGRRKPILTATPSGKLGPIIGGQARVTPRGIEG
jgi:hypothetical protein